MDVGFLSPFVRVKGKKMICSEKSSAESLSRTRASNVRLQPVRGKEKNRSCKKGSLFSCLPWMKDTRCPGTNLESLNTDHRYNLTVNIDRKQRGTPAVGSGQCMTIPLQFALDMMTDSPNSYLMLSDISKENRKRKLCLQGADELDSLQVYTMPKLKLVQLGDDEDVPVEYTVAFLSKKAVDKAWKYGRKYFISAALASKHMARQSKFDRAHAKAASIVAQNGGISFPGDSSGPASEMGEESIEEPPEVQELAAELGIGNPLPTPTRDAGSPQR